MRKLVGTVTLVLLLLSLIAIGFAVYRVVRYRQVDDVHHLELKQKYLASLPKITGSMPRQPNVIVILFDDLGYGDLGVYGSQAIKTPHIDALAMNGTMLTNFYAAAPYCTPSRAGLLTGRYPVHAGLTAITFPDSSPFAWLAKLGGTHVRLPAEEITIAEILHGAGYRTGLFGKWHLGHHSPSLPNDLGFEEFVGLHHSNDMRPLPLWHNDQIVEPDPVDQASLTRRFTSEAVRFIESHADEPFFVDLSPTAPHIPLDVSEDRKGRSDGGLYGDVIEELDDSVGQIVDAVRKIGAEHNTLLLISSDNGPWYQGSPGTVRGRKNDVFEGGVRVPFVASWPGRIPAGRVVADIAMAIDILPTILDLTGLAAPQDRVLDGVSLLPLLQERGKQPHDDLYFFKGDALMAVRSGRYKYHRRQYLFPGTQIELPAMALIPQGPWLFDLTLDANESYDISDRQPGIAHRLRVMLEARQRDLAANPRGWR